MFEERFFVTTTSLYYFMKSLQEKEKFKKMKVLLFPIILLVLEVNIHHVKF